MSRSTRANKTQPHGADVGKFINSVEHAGRRQDAQTLLPLMASISGETPRMWGPTIVGFGQYHYVYESGREGDHFLVGFAPRKANMVVYIMPGFSEYDDLLQQLGKHRTGSSCLYLGRLQGIDMAVLGRLIDVSVKHMRKKWL